MKPRYLGHRPNGCESRPAEIIRAGQGARGTWRVGPSGRSDRLFLWQRFSRVRFSGSDHGVWAVGHLPRANDGLNACHASVILKNLMSWLRLWRPSSFVTNASHVTDSTRCR